MIQRLVSLAFRNGVRKGVVGGSNPWLVVAVAAGAIKLLNRPPKATKSHVIHLKPGERYSVVCSTDE